MKFNYEKKFDYKTNFKVDKHRQRFINKTIASGEFYVNREGVLISKEYPKNEKNNVNNKLYDTKNFRNKKRKYYFDILKLCKKYYKDFINVLEVGAGTGQFAEMYINKFSPKSYTFYENSNPMVKKIKKRFTVEGPTRISIKKKSFKDLSEFKLSRYDCVIALQVFEHINWDKEFLSKISPGTWVFFSVPTIHDTLHTRAYLTPDSIFYRYKDILDIHLIKEVRRVINFNSKHNYPMHWVIASQRNDN